MVVVVVTVLVVETPLTVGTKEGLGENMVSPLLVGCGVGGGSADAKAMADEEGEGLTRERRPVVKRKTK